MESKEYSWKWVTADELLSRVECELVWCILTSSGNNASITLHNGESATGETIATLEALANRSEPFMPPIPIYCTRGLYVNIDANTTGVLVIWREIPQGIGYPR